MKKLLKRLTAVLLAVTVILSLAQFAGAADSQSRIYEGICGEDLRTNVTWRLDTSTGELVISGTGRMQSWEHVTSPWCDLRVKSAVINSGVTSIGVNAFYYCRELESVTIADTVTEIGDMAFYYCKDLKEVVIPDSVEKMGREIFTWCENLRSIKLSASLSQVGTEITRDCENLTNVVLPEENEHFYLDESFVLYNKDKTKLISALREKSVVAYSVPEGVVCIEPSAFMRNEHIKSITLPASLENIEQNAFYHCENLENVTFAKNSRLKTLGAAAFYCCVKLNGILNLPQSIESMGDYAFYNTALQRNESNWTNGVLYLGDYLIETDSSLTGHFEIKEGTKGFFGDLPSGTTSVSFPASLTSIQRDFFNWYARNLEKIYVSPENESFIIDENGVLFSKDKTVLFRYPVKNLNITSYSIPDGVKVIAPYAFSDAEYLTRIILPDTVTTVGRNAIYNCTALEEIAIPASVKEIDIQSFSNNPNVKSLTFAEGIELETIAISAFSNLSGVEHITIPASVKEIKQAAFSSCASLVSVEFEEGSKLEKLEDVFSLCVKLKNISIPEGVTEYGYTMFFGCSSLESIEIGASVEKIGSKAFSNCPKLSGITVDEENKFFKVDEYGVLYNADKTLLVRCPEGNTAAVDYVIPDTVKEIQAEAFRNNTALRSTNIPEGIKFVGACAFENCKGLTKVDYEATDCVIFGETIASEGVYYAFLGCENLTEINITSNVESIPDTAFAETSVTGIKIPSNVSSIGVYAFLRCKKLSTLVFEEESNLEYIEEGAFAGCSSIRFVELPDSITSVGYSAFNGCNSLEYIIVPVSVKNLDRNFVADYTEIRYCGHEWEWNLIDKHDMDYSLYTVIFNYGKTPIERKDSGSGIIVEGLYAEDYEGDVTLEAKECDKDEANFVLQTEIFINRKKQLYDISLSCNGETVQPGGAVTVHVPKPQGFKEKYTHLYYVKPQTNEKEEIPFTVSGDYLIFTIDHFSYYALVEDFSLSILRNPGTATVDYGESLRLTAEHNGTNGETVYWYLDGVLAGKGDTVTVTPDSAGSEVSAVLCDKDGKELADMDGNTITDSQKIAVNAGFFKRLISFFKNLFRLDRTVTQ